MATKGYKDNEQQAFTPTPTDWLGIQQGSLLSDMKKITYKDLTDPLQGQIDDHEQRVDDLELAEGSIKGVGWTGETVKGNADAIGELDGRLDTLEGTGEGSVAKAIDDAVSPLDENKADKATTYTKIENDAQLLLKADKSTTYTKTEVDVTIDALDTRLDTLEGTGYTEGSLKTHEDRLDTLEGISEGSVAKAIDDGNNQTMAETMGFAPRNLMTVFGTSTVAETFAELRARAITGDFRTLRLGDYIDLPSLTIGADSVNPTVYPARTINNDYNKLRVEIVGFDDYYYVGNTAYPTQHHVTMMFKDIPTTAPFNETNITTGDYPGSMLFHWLHEQIEPALISAIGLTPRPVDRIIGTVANWAWVGSETIFLPTNVNIFGTTGFSHTNYGTGTQTQFALFAMNPNRKIKRRNGSRYYWWLAEPSAGSSTSFCTANYLGYAGNSGASNTLGVVPAFLI